MKKSRNIIPNEVIQGRNTWLKRIIKSNRLLYRLIFQLRNCNHFVFILKNFWRDTDSLFKFLIIETCPLCNRQCSFCPVSQDKIPKEMMNDKLFNKILTELKELNFHDNICLTSYGEPLLDKRLARFIKQIKTTLGSEVAIFTNGDFLTIEKFKELVSAGIDRIHISQHDSEPSETIKNLFSQISQDELKYISYEFTNENSVTLANRGGLVEVKTLHPFYCSPQQMIIRADGSVPLCCNDYYKEVNFGNVKEEKLIAIWNKPFYRKIRNEIKKGIFNLEICKKCLGIK